MTLAIRSRRLSRCERCGLAQQLCLCAELPRIATTTSVMILMHRNEVGRTSNTGRLALAVLERGRVSIRGAPGVVPEPIPTGRRVVLFPLADARELEAPDADGPLTLVVPDGSWSQAKRMLAREPWARAAEVVRLPASSRASRYDLRRQNRPGAMCTFEAVARALGVLEGPEVELEMLRVLDAFLVRVRQMRALGGQLRGG